ncbi:MAG TPA: hypothetical protein VF862_09290 [Gemmatimonadales bacterium]
MKNIVKRLKELVEDLEGVIARHEDFREMGPEQFELKAPEPRKAPPPGLHTPLKNPSHQKSGRTLQGRDPTPGIKGGRPILTPRLDTRQRNSTGAHRRGRG